MSARKNSSRLRFLAQRSRHPAGAPAPPPEPGHRWTSSDDKQLWMMATLNVVIGTHASSWARVQPSARASPISLRPFGSKLWQRCALCVDQLHWLVTPALCGGSAVLLAFRPPPLLRVRPPRPAAARSDWAAATAVLHARGFRLRPRPREGGRSASSLNRSCSPAWATGRRERESPTPTDVAVAMRSPEER